MAVVDAQTTGFQSNAYQGKQIWLDYVQEIYNKKAYFNQCMTTPQLRMI